MKLKTALISIVLLLILAGCSAEEQKSVPIKVTYTDTNRVQIELDPNWKNAVEVMTERQVILVAHHYMNYLWCDENGVEIKGEPNEIFQALKDRWGEFQFNPDNDINNPEFWLKYEVNEALTNAMKEDTINHNQAHRTMHELDYWVLRISSQGPYYAEQYPDASHFQVDQLKDWRRDE